MRHWLAALALAAAPVAATAQAGDPAMDVAVRDLCPRQVAMLGEASHGDGATLAFKAALVRRLAKECGFTAILFEAGHYDFVELMRRLRAGEPATPAMLSSAIGGVWNRYAELTPLIAFLFDEARAGRLTLGGIDDQLGSAGAFYSLDEMPTRLAAPLSDQYREGCRRALRERIYSGPLPGGGETAGRRLALTVCAAQMNLLAADEDMRHLADVMAGLFARDGTEDALVRGRDAAMFALLQWYRARLGRRAKLIVWAHNAHIARDATAYPRFAPGGNLGARVARAYGRGAFALGFSAYGGSWQRLPFMQEPRPLEPAPAGSLEAGAFGAGEAGIAYLGAGRLRAAGRAPGRPFNYEFAPADWSRVFDGMIVFRAERPPQRAR